jgi:hypothetical protein
MSLTHIFYGGNGTTPVDSGLPRVGVIHGVRENGDLLWYRYDGHGESDRSGTMGWHSNSGNPIGNGWQNFRHILGCGDGVILGVHQNGDLLWYKYDGNGESDRSGSQGWHPNSGNPIGNGWQGFRHVFVTPQEGRTSSSRLTVYGVAQNGDLLWYSYHGNGESDRSGSVGWHSNSGNPIGNGWQNFRAVFGGVNDSGGFGHVVYAVAQNGDLLWYRYDGHGERDPSGSLGWRPNSGNAIGNGW